MPGHVGLTKSRRHCSGPLSGVAKSQLNVQVMYIFSFTCEFLFDWGEPFEQFLSLRKKSLFLLVGQILGVPGVPRDVGTPRGAEGPHGPWEERTDDGRRCPDGGGDVIGCVGGFRGGLERKMTGRHAGRRKHITKEARLECFNAPPTSHQTEQVRAPKVSLCDLRSTKRNFCDVKLKLKRFFLVVLDSRVVYCCVALEIT